jgi:hypothetical protein
VRSPQRARDARNVDIAVIGTLLLFALAELARC